MRGKRVGVPDYVMTAALWMGIISANFMASCDEIPCTSAGPAMATAGCSARIRPPAGVSLTWLTVAETFDVDARPRRD